MSLIRFSTNACTAVDRQLKIVLFDDGSRSACLITLVPLRRYATIYLPFVVLVSLLSLSCLLFVCLLGAGCFVLFGWLPLVASSCSFDCLSFFCVSLSVFVCCRAMFLILC